MPNFKLGNMINVDGNTYQVVKVQEIDDEISPPVYYLKDNKTNINSTKLIKHVDQYATFDVSKSFENMKISGGKHRTRRNKLRKKRRKTNRRKTNRRKTNRRR
jgi:hypothetical protein